MKQEMIFLPMLGHILLVLWMYIHLGRVKFKAKKEGLVDVKRASLHNDGWPENVLQVVNNVKNQFELPSLFHIICIIFFLTQSVNLAVFGLATLFCVSRYAHAYVHVTSNYVPIRLRFFIIGALTVLLMALVLIVTLLSVI